jgi:pimeloyl-ACP methyl ester carboxylesterase
LSGKLLLNITLLVSNCYRYKMEKYITVTGRQIYCRFHNEHLLKQELPLLVFLHEGLGSSGQWKDFPAQLTEQIPLPVLMYDRYGYGKSEEIQESRTPDYMEQEALVFLPEILKTLNLADKKILLFGHSDGGSIALFYASFFPENVIAAIIEAPHFFLDHISLTGIRTAVELYEKGNLKQKLKKYHRQKTESMFRTWTNILLSEEMRDWNTLHLLKNVQCPVLAVQGTDDDFGTLRQIESIRDNIQGKAQLLVIPDCGHIPHHMKRKEVVVAAEKFLMQNI